MARTRRQRGRFRWLYYVVVALLVAGIATFGYLSYRGFQPGRNIASVFEPPFGGRQQVNVLVLGQDNAGQVRRSDTMMVFTVDLPNKRLAGFSVPRDFRVEVPGHDTEKINAAFSLGGKDLAKATLESTLGVTLDYYVLVDVAGLRKLVDAMGGVVIDVDRRMHYRDRSQDLLIDLRSGRQRLNGRQAEGYVRFRHDALGDLKRIQRQQAFMKAVMAQLLQPDKIVRFPAMLDAFMAAVKTDLTVRDLQAIKDVAQAQEGRPIEMKTLPGTPVNLHGISYLEPDWPACRELVGQIMHGWKALVTVLNGTTREGLGAAVADRLLEAGYRIEMVDNASQPVSVTKIIAYHKPESAHQIQKLLGYGEVVESGQPGPGVGADITVLLGEDARVSPRPLRPE